MRMGRVIVGALLVSAHVVLVASCNDDDTQSSQPQLQSANYASIDVRGGGVQRSTQLPSFSAPGGEGGVGGTLRVNSANGDVTVSAAASSTAAQTPLIAGNGLDVFTGTTVRVSGLQSVDFLRVQSGANLILMDDTFFQVNGDVDISGTISTSPTEGTDANDLMIDAGGIVNISGSIECKGLSNVTSDDRSFLGAGKGGEVFIFARAAVVATTGPHIHVSGIIDVSGGDATELFSRDTSARAGRGGDILVGAGGSMVINGKLLARGGTTGFGLQLAFTDGFFADAGNVDLTAMDDIEFGNALEIDASGGSSMGTTGGDAGVVSIEAPIGTLSMIGTNVRANGGNVQFADSNRSGLGGRISLFGDALAHNGGVVEANGGGIARGVGIGGQNVVGIGADAGDIHVAGLTQVSFSFTSQINLIGGDSNREFDAGGSGGDLKIVNLTESDLSILSFGGGVEVRGGIDAAGTSGPDGAICVRGASADVVAAIASVNDFPVETCPLDATGGIAGALFTSHDLDCDTTNITDTTNIIPSDPSDVLAVSTPAATGVDFYRVRVAGQTEVQISTLVGGSGDIDLFAGESEALGSLDPLDYAFSSTTPDDSAEQITVDLNAFTPGAFIAVFVRERGLVVGDYSLNVSCQ